MHLSFDFIFDRVMAWHLIDVSAVAGHGAMSAVLL